MITEQAIDLVAERYATLPGWDHLTKAHIRGCALSEVEALHALGLLPLDDKQPRTALWPSSPPPKRFICKVGKCNADRPGICELHGECGASMSAVLNHLCQQKPEPVDLSDLKPLPIRTVCAPGQERCNLYAPGGPVMCVCDPPPKPRQFNDCQGERPTLNEVQWCFPTRDGRPCPPIRDTDMRRVLDENGVQIVRWDDQAQSWVIGKWRYVMQGDRLVAIDKVQP